jgi:hypothetical protein
MLNHQLLQQLFTPGMPAAEGVPEMSDPFATTKVSHENFVQERLLQVGEVNVASICTAIASTVKHVGCKSDFGEHGLGEGLS